ncbi:MAG: type II and III secretion system protein, partial [Acidobacteriota bacterium]
MACSPAGSFSPRPGITRGGTATAASTSVPFSNLGRLSSGDWATSLPGAILQAMLTDTRTKVLNNPQVRATEGQKARLEIGDRIPIASGSFQTGVTGATGVGVNTTFQFQPVGVIVDITPQQVHSSDEVTLHIELEVSNVKSYIDVGSIRQPIVGQNKSTADIRMREGEVSILAGLTRNQNTDTSAGLPGLIDIPVLGKFFFGNNHTERDRGDLMIALIPHIVRTPDFTSENLRGVFAGNDQQLRLMYAPANEQVGSVPAPPAAPSGAPCSG